MRFLRCATAHQLVGSVYLEYSRLTKLLSCQVKNTSGDHENEDSVLILTQIKESLGVKLLLLILDRCTWRQYVKALQHFRKR